MAGDIGEPATAQRVIREAIARFGRIDTLVNNAGIFIAKPFTAYTAEDYANVLSVNLNGFFYITQLAIAEMEKTAAATSSTSPPAWWTTPSTACHRYWLR